MSLSEQINKIIDRRIGRNGNPGRLPVIRQKKEFFASAREAVAGFQSLRAAILAQIDAEQGEFYQMSLDDPMLRDNVEAADPVRLLAELDACSLECDRLEMRFNRDTVNISVIGLAGQGKSTILQSIGNLDNAIIPAADGADCTGAKSVICNHDGQTYAKIIFYSPDEMVEQVKRYLTALGINYVLTTPAQIPSLSSLIAHFRESKMVTEGGETKNFLTFEQGEMLKHIEKYINHYHEYGPLVGTTIEVPEHQIRDYVAQYRENGEKTYSYLAVKEAQIFTKFNYADAGKITLVDTIGLGDTALGIQEKLIETLQKDSDAAIMLRKPKDGKETVMREQDSQLIKVIENTIGIEHLKQWLFLAINASVGMGTYEYGNSLKSNLESDSGNFRCAHMDVVDCSNPTDVENKMLVPLLTHLTNNLDSVDEALMKNANKTFEACHSQYVAFCDKVSPIIKNSIRKAFDMGGQFDVLYEDLALGRELEQLTMSYADHNHKSSEIEQELKNVLRNIRVCLPSVDEIENALTAGKRGAHLANVYNNAADTTRAAICDMFDGINTTVVVKLQDEMKERVVNVLRGAGGGRLGAIALDGAAADAPAAEWLEAFITEKLDIFPIIEKAFRGILDYKLSVESLLDYQLNRCLTALEVGSADFPGPPALPASSTSREQAEAVHQSLLSAVPYMARNLLAGCDDIMKVPCNSFYARVRKLREQILYSREGERQLKSLYRRFATQVWAADIKATVARNAAYDQIENAYNALNGKRAKSMFTININK